MVLQTSFEPVLADGAGAHPVAAVQPVDAPARVPGGADDAPSGIALRVDGLSKCHSIYEHPRDRLKQFLLPPARGLLELPPKQYFREFWALREVSFEVRRGESVAIIGRNGSGKSTLLQMISGTLTPTEGTVQTNGRIAALLELGSGFNTDFTGRENVFLNGAILGMTTREIEQKLDAILAFADIGDFIDQPVKTYSSGMYVRLAFAIQVHVEPEILIVDEALSVGDFFFQQKCFARIRRMRDDGLTLLYVSHDMGTVRDLCSRAVYLRQGRAVYVGETLGAVRRYLAEGDAAPGAPAPPVLPAAAAAEGAPDALEAARQVALWCRPEATATNLLAVVVRDEAGQPTTRVRMGDKLRFEIWFRTLGEPHAHLSLILKNRYDQVVCCTGSYHLGLPALETPAGGHGVLELTVDCAIESGLYSLLVNYGPSGVPAVNQGTVADKTDWFGPIQVEWDYASAVAPFLGQVGLPVVATLRECDPRAGENTEIHRIPAGGLES